MRTEWRSTLCAWITRLLYFNVPRPLIYAYVVTLVLVYFFVAVHTPMSLHPPRIHDDGLYASLGQYLAEGHWLGPYSEFTLAKGPGYPAFLAGVNWLGIPISVVYPLLYCAAVIFFVIVAHQFIKSFLVSGLLLAFLLWHPVSFTLFRIIREQIYPAQTLLVLALLGCALLLNLQPRIRLLCAVLGGLALGWFWLTREEGVWILPGLSILVAGGAVAAIRQHRLRELGATLLILLAVFAATQIGFRTMNFLNYGKLVGVDFKEKNFQRALGAINSVRSDGVTRYLSVSRDARQRIYAVSPAFAALRNYLDGNAASGWRKFTCDAYPAICGEIAVGWFMWALRTAAAQQGFYKSPEEASRFFGQMADEISTACARGSLECVKQPLSELPPVTWQQLVTYVPPRFLDGIDLLVRPKLSLPMLPSSGSEEQLARTLKFLNYPSYVASPEDTTGTDDYILQGWYYRSGQDWFSASVENANAAPAYFRFKRNASPDIARGKNDPAAVSQRFTIETRCDQRCSLHVYSSDNQEIRLELGQPRKVPFGVAIGQGTLVFDRFDRVSAMPNELSPVLQAEELSRRIRETVITYYSTIALPFVVLGLVAFILATLLYWREVLFNSCYLFAMVSWLLVFVRLLLLVLIDVTSFQALQSLYLAPAYFLLVSGVFFSIAALPQLACCSEVATYGRGSSLERRP